MVERIEVPHAGSERATLNAFLDFQRVTFEQKIDGLSREQLVRRHVPSKTTLLGMTKHLIDVEQWWFSAVLAGLPDAPYFWDKDGIFDSDFDINDDDDPAALKQLYREQCERSRAIVESTSSLDDVAKRADADHTLRWILVHMIEETARHVGHADILRELTDGSVGE